MGEKRKPQDLLEWLAIKDAPNWGVARPLGGFLGFVLGMLFLLALAAAFKLLIGTVFAPVEGGLGNLGAGALIVALLGAPFLIWSTVLKHQTVRFQKEGHMTDRINKAVEQLGAEKTVKRRAKDAEGKDITIEETLPNIEVRIGAALLHISGERRTSPFRERTHPTASVTGMPSAVKPFSTATRIWNSAT